MARNHNDPGRKQEKNFFDIDYDYDKYDPDRDISSHSSPNRSSGSPMQKPQRDEPIDRYHYVDDIYSNSKPGRQRNTAPPQRQPQKQQPNRYDPDMFAPEPPKKKKKKRIWPKVLIILGSVLVAIIVAIIILVSVLFARLDTQEVNTDQYVETPYEAAAYEVIDDPDVWNVLVIGADKDPDGSNGRSDTMMVLSINSKTNKVKIVSFLRDLYIDIPGHGKDRLNAAYSYGGAAMLMQTIENNFRINIDDYLETNFAGFEQIIDSMGGIEVTMTAAEAQFINEWKKVGAVEGVNHLNGKNALYFARMRKLDSDFGRTTRQRQVVSAMFDKLKSSNPVTMYSVAYNLMPNLTTNLSSGELLSFAMAFTKMNEAETLSVPEYGRFYDYTTPAGAMVLVPYYDANIEALRAFLYE